MPVPLAPVIATKKRYELIARRAAFVGALARDLGEHPAIGVRGVALSHTDALHDEWTVVVLAPHCAGVFAARDLGPFDLPDTKRSFEYAVTHDRELVIAAATRLMQRLARSAQWLPATGAPARALLLDMSS
jgi:DICT domain-containing protein